MSGRFDIPVPLLRHFCEGITLLNPFLVTPAKAGVHTHLHLGSRSEPAPYLDTGAGMTRILLSTSLAFPRKYTPYSDTGQEPRAFHTKCRSFAGRGFRLLTPLRYVRNDSWRAILSFLRKQESKADADAGGTPLDSRLEAGP